MKTINIRTKLNITHEWLVWTPKRGTYANSTKYVCLVNNPVEFSPGAFQCIVAGFHKRTGEPTLSLGAITAYQYAKNTAECKDEEIIKQFEEIFLVYKKQWEENRIVKKAKLLLTGH